MLINTGKNNKREFGLINRFNELNIKQAKSDNSVNHKSSAYYLNVAYILAFFVLIKSGSSLAKTDGETVVNLDVNSRDIYLAEKKLKTFQIVAAKFAKKYSDNKKVRKSMRRIITDIVRLSMKLETISPEIIAINLLFEWFIDTNHPKIDKDFSFFTNADSYYPILDRVESSSLIDAKEIFELARDIIVRNR